MITFWQFAAWTGGAFLCAGAPWLPQNKFSKIANSAWHIVLIAYITSLYLEG